jgi:toxin-antitoxin system PIN domain toxin
MIAVDTNILVHAHRADAVWHDRARAAVESLANGSSAWTIPWPCVHEFLAIVTHPRIFTPPTPTPRAIDQIDAWFESPRLVLLAEGATHWEALRHLITAGRIAGPVVHDARIAALCLDHGVSQLWTADRDFSKFSELTVRNPLPET